MTFEALSKNPLVLPGACWLALPIVLGFALRCRGFFRIWGLVFGALIALDASLNGTLSPLREGSTWSVVSGIAFVILGDLRFFMAAEWDGSRASLVRAFGLAWIVPLCSQTLRAAFPALAATPRATYLAYEVLFLVVLVVWFGVRVRSWAADRRHFAARLARFFGLQYGLWAAVDVFLLNVPMPQADVGLGLRMVPDLLYYVAFVPWVLALRSRRPQISAFMETRSE